MYVLNIEVQVEPAPTTTSNLTYSAPSEDGDAEVVEPVQKTQPPKASGQGSSFFKNN